MRTNLLLLSIAIVLQWPLCAATASAQNQVRFQVRTHVDDKTVAPGIPSPFIETYGLSSDGARLALLVVSGDPMQGPVPSWVVVARTIDGKVLKKVRVGIGAKFVEGYASAVVFTADGKLLVVEDGEPTVSVLDAATLETVRTFGPDKGSRFKVPARVVMADGNVAAISFGVGNTGANYLDKLPVHTVIVDVSNGKRVGSWDGDDIPFSVSPSAKYVAESDPSTAGPVMDVAILDARSGKKVATLSGGYASRIPGYPHRSGRFWTRIIAKFIGDDEVILTPDGNYDQSGHALARDVKIVTTNNDQVVQEIAAENYGPTGEIAVSADRSTFIAISRYLAPEYLTHHWRIPSDTKPELLVFRRQRQRVFKLVSRTEVPELLGLRMRGPFDESGLRVSRDGSVVSIAEHYGITVLSGN